MSKMDEAERDAKKVLDEFTGGGKDAYCSISALREAIASALRERDKRIAELEKAVDYYERDGAMIKHAPIKMINETILRTRIKELEGALRKVVEKANEFMSADDSIRYGHSKEHREFWSAIGEAEQALESKESDNNKGMTPIMKMEKASESQEGGKENAGN